MSQKKVGDKLSHISNSGAVASLTEGDVHGWYNSYAYFNNNPSEGINDPVNGFLNSGKFLNSRGYLPYYRPDGTQVFSPYERFNGCGIVLAKDRNYSPEYTDNQIGTQQDFYRMYYHPTLRTDAGSTSDTWPLPDYTFSLILGDLDPPSANVFLDVDDAPEAVGVGGYLFNYAASGGAWTINIGNIQYNQDYFFQFGSEGPGTGDLNSDNFASTADLLALLTEYNQNQSHDSIYGGPKPTTGPLAMGLEGHFREVMLEPPSYPNAGLVSEEIVEYPQRWTMHIHDGIRNSTFGISLSTLASILGQIMTTVDFSEVAGGNVNLTMPLLSTAQLNNFYQTTGGADLNSDGSVSTADLLEFLVAFGQEGDPVAITGRNFDSFLLYHNGSVNFEYPFYSLESDFIEQLDDPINANTSLGTVNLDSALPWEYLDPIVPGGSFNDLYAVDTIAAEINYRLIWMTANNFQEHTSPQFGALYGEVENFPALSNFWMKGSHFDLIQSFLNTVGHVRYEEFSDANNLQVLSALNVDFGEITFSTTTDFPANNVSIPAPSYLYENGNNGGNYLRFKELPFETLSYIAQDCRLIVECQGYVKCNTGSDPIVGIFVRDHVPGTNAEQINPAGADNGGGYYGGLWVLWMGSVDMSQDYQIVDGEKVKNFTMFMDPHQIGDLPYYTDDEKSACTRFGIGSIVAASAYVRDFTLGATAFIDSASSVVFTSVAYRLKNSKNVVS